MPLELRLSSSGRPSRGPGRGGRRGARLPVVTWARCSRTQVRASRDLQLKCVGAAAVQAVRLSCTGSLGNFQAAVRLCTMHERSSTARTRVSRIALVYRRGSCSQETHQPLLRVTVHQRCAAIAARSARGAHKHNQRPAVGLLQPLSAHFMSAAVPLDAKTTVSVKFDGAVQACAVSLASREAFLDDLRAQLKLPVHTQLTVLEWDKGFDDFVVLSNPSELKEGTVLKVKVNTVGSMAVHEETAAPAAAPGPRPAARLEETAGQDMVLMANWQS